MDDVDDLVRELTLAEKCRMVSGEDLWLIPGCERLGIPGWRVSDGPVGVRGRSTSKGLTLPGPTAMAATWDVELVEQLGAALGAECADRDVDLLLAPTVNLHRSPRGGRHFEMFSEDPELTARMAVAYISGVQSQGVGACVKHFVANDQEHERFTIDAQIDEPTLREVHLPPFEAAVKEAGVRSVMAAYNFVNGAHACANPELLLDVLKHEWGFDGIVVSDWGAMKGTIAPARNGLDVEMPGPGRWWGNGQLEATVRAGEVDESLIDDKVRRILHFLRWRGRLPAETTTADERPVERPEHRALARRAATDGMVLLRNDGALPLDPTMRLALIGPGVASTALLGGGSASLTPYRSTTVLDAMSARWSGSIAHAEGVSLRRTAPSVPTAWIGADGVEAELYAGMGFDGDAIRVERVRGVQNWWYGDTFPAGIDLLSVRLRFTMTPDVSGRYRVVGAGYGGARLFFDGALVADSEVDGFPAGVGLHAGTCDMTLEAGRTYHVILEQTPEAGSVPAALTDVGIAPDDNREAGILEAERAAANADVAVVVVGSSAEWEFEGADRKTLELPREQDELVRRVVVANSRTVVVLNCGAPMLLPWLEDAAATLLAWYPGQEGSDAIVDVLVGEADPGGRMPTTWARAERDTPAFRYYPGEAGVVRYGEGLNVGYRSYDARSIDPLLPFGYGNSYTTFDWAHPTVFGNGSEIVVEVAVRNIGDRPGTDVVQVYVEPPRATSRPTKVLGGFAKVKLDPGAQSIAAVRVRTSAFARWDLAAHEWLIDEGTYGISVAASAEDVRFRVEHKI